MLFSSSLLLLLFSCCVLCMVCLNILSVSPVCSACPQPVCDCSGLAFNERRQKACNSFAHCQPDSAYAQYFLVMRLFRKGEGKANVICLPIESKYNIVILLNLPHCRYLTNALLNRTYLYLPQVIKLPRLHALCGAACVKNN